MTQRAKAEAADQVATLRKESAETIDRLLRLKVSEILQKAKMESNYEVEFENMKEDIRRGRDEAGHALEKAISDFRGE